MDATLPEQNAFDPAALTGILRRRWMAVAITALVLVVAAFVTALVWPPTFRSFRPIRASSTRRS